MNEKELVSRLKKRYNRLKTIRMEPEKRWKDSVRYVVPQLKNFGDNEWHDLRYDPTATTASEMLADGMYGNICAPTLDWIRLRYEDQDLNDSRAAAEYMDEVQKVLYRAFERSTFYGVMPTFLRYGNTIGTVSMHIEEKISEAKILCTVRHPGEIFIITDSYGEVIGHVRDFVMTAEQAEEQFPDATDKFSEPLKRELKNNPDQEFRFYNFLMPWEYVFKKRRGEMDKKFVSIYIEQNGDSVLRQDGYDVNPSPTWRWSIRGNEPYGYCPTDDAMPDILSVNQIRRTMLELAERTANPPVFAPEHMDVDLSPGYINRYRDASEKVYEGRYGSYPVPDRELERIREQIKQTYKTHHFLLTTEQDKQMTAREVMERKTEKVSVIGSTIGRLESDALKPIIRRFLQIEFEASRIPRPPDALAERIYADRLKIEFQGPLAQAQKELQAMQSVLETLQLSAVFFEIWPETRMKFNPEKMLEELLQARGVSEKSFKSSKEYEKVLAAMAQRQAQAAEAEQMKEMSKAVPNLSKKPESGSPIETLMGA